MNTTDNLEIIEGEITRVTRFDSGYTILALKRGRESIKLVGDMPNFAEGMNISAKCERTTHPKYGDQFKVIEIEERGFSSADSIVNYLASNSFKGIGKAVARMIVNHFGVETFDILDKNPDRLFEVPGLPESKAQIIIETWVAERASHKIRSELIKMGMSPLMATKAHKHFGDEVLTFVEENPYCLTEVSGIGFWRADDIALKAGIARNSPHRVEASLRYVLDQALMGGDCYLHLSILSEESIKLLKNDVNATHIVEAMRRMVSRGTLVNEKNKIFLSGIRQAEQQVAEMLLSMANYKSDPLYTSVEELRHKLMSIGGTGQITLAPNQEEALFTAINSRVSIITGGPGTGKSTITKALCSLFDCHNLDFKLCAPTGRASKRLAEATESEAKTIHRLLQFDPMNGGFLFKEGSPLPTQVVIVDESSMVDILLFRHLLLAMESHMRLVIVGDKDQLPSVGPGNVLRDLIASHFLWKLMQS
jgi:exodeoxyribonuclease V alpha subunit